LDSIFAISTWIQNEGLVLATAICKIFLLACVGAFLFSILLHVGAKKLGLFQINGKQRGWAKWLYVMTLWGHVFPCFAIALTILGVDKTVFNFLRQESKNNGTTQIVGNFLIDPKQLMILLPEGDIKNLVEKNIFVNADPHQLFEKLVSFKETFVFLSKAYQKDIVQRLEQYLGGSLKEIPMTEWLLKETTLSFSGLLDPKYVDDYVRLHDQGRKWLHDPLLNKQAITKTGDAFFQEVLRVEWNEWCWHYFGLLIVIGLVPLVVLTLFIQGIGRWIHREKVVLEVSL